MSEVEHRYVLIDQNYHNTPDGYTGPGTIGVAHVVTLHVFEGKIMYWRMFIGAGPCYEDELTEYVAHWGNCLPEKLARTILNYYDPTKKSFIHFFEKPYRT